MIWIAHQITLKSVKDKNKNYVKYDIGVQSNYNNIWSTNTTSSTIIVTRTKEYTELKEANVGTNFSNATNELSEGCIVEFDYYQVDGGNNSFLQIQDSTNTQIYSGGINLNHFGGTIGNWYHLKFEFKNGAMTCTNTTNGTSFNRKYTSSPNKFNWWSSSEITTIRFKNFIICSQ